MAAKTEEMKAVTVKLPKGMLEEIDQICAANYTTRTSWMIKAARSLLEGERVRTSEEILEKIANKERQMNDNK